MPKIDYTKRGQKSSLKKKNKRQKSKYPALDPHLNLITRQKQIDYDYLDKLTPKELEFLNQFTKETVGAAVNVEDRRKNLYARTKKKVKECFDSNNARNRDILTRQEAMKTIKDLEEIKEFTQNPEDELNSRIDLQMMGFTDEYGELDKSKTYILDTPKLVQKQKKQKKKSI